MAKRHSSKRSAPTATRRGREFWRKVVAEQDSTGESGREISERLDLNANTLNWWRWRLRHETAQPEADAIPEFLPVRVLGGELPLDSVVEVALSNGRKVRVSPGFSPELLAQVVTTLEALP